MTQCNLAPNQIIIQFDRPIAEFINNDAIDLRLELINPHIQGEGDTTAFTALEFTINALIKNFKAT